MVTVQDQYPVESITQEGAVAATLRVCALDGLANWQTAWLAPTPLSVSAMVHVTSCD